ncbi:hypothetical protein [Acidicapsa acidisoli]|uniref:hypothetical protein n=1 Tax=Acidicapsa acidisoli TaxID=1615681 RepID=UPI0021DFE56B|nr:hypothetical protein [Acidicapsa acidisoli]
MTDQLLFNWLVDLAGLAMIFTVWQVFWKPQRIDILRESLFELRDELFDLAASGKVSFEDPAYKQLRLLINGTIRFAHMATLPVLLTTSLMLRNSNPRSYQDWLRSLESVPAEVRKDLKNIHSRVFTAYFRHLVGGSFILVGLGLSIGVAILAKSAFSFLTGKRRGPLMIGTLSRLMDKATRKAASVAKASPERLEGVLVDEGMRGNPHVFA